jgi:hypothetical protein
MLNLSIAIMALTTGIVSSGPPLTAKDRADAARDCATTFLEGLKEHSSEPMKPKITDVRENHPTRRAEGLTAEAVLISSKKLGVRMTMNVVGDAMVIQTAHFGVPFHKEEAHPSGDKSLDVLESCLTALLASSNHTEKQRQQIMEEWRTHRPALMQIGKRHEVTVDDVRYAFHSLPGTVHVSFILNAKANKTPY